MTMDLTQGGFFKAYLKALTDIQLDALVDWNDTRLADNPSDDTITDALDRKRIIYQEVLRRRRDNPRR